MNQLPHQHLQISKEKNDRWLGERGEVGDIAQNGYCSRDITVELEA